MKTPILPRRFLLTFNMEVLVGGGTGEMGKNKKKEINMGVGGCQM